MLRLGAYDTLPRACRGPTPHNPAYPTTPGTAVPFASFTASFKFPTPTGLQSFSLPDDAEVIPSVALAASGDVSAFRYNDMGASVEFVRHFIPEPPQVYYRADLSFGPSSFRWQWMRAGQNPLHGGGPGYWVHESAAVPDSGAMLAMVALGLAGLSGLRLRRQ